MGKYLFLGEDGMETNGECGSGKVCLKNGYLILEYKEELGRGGADWDDFPSETGKHY